MNTHPNDLIEKVFERTAFTVGNVHFSSDIQADKIRVFNDWNRTVGNIVKTDTIISENVKIGFTPSKVEFTQINYRVYDVTSAIDINSEKLASSVVACAKAIDLHHKELAYAGNVVLIFNNIVSIKRYQGEWTLANIGQDVSDIQISRLNGLIGEELQTSLWESEF